MMLTLRSTLSFLVVLFFVCGPVTPLLAQFNYGNFNGTSVVYQQVTEQSTTDPLVQLFGAPGISGDALTFSPVNFGITTSGGSFDIMDGTLTTSINSLQSSVINKLQFDERGDYSLAGLGTTATSAQVAMSLFVRILDTDAPGIPTPVNWSTNAIFSPSGGTYNLINDPGLNVIWLGGVEVDLAAILAGAGVPGGATKVDISLDNSLLAFSESGTIAFIKKKQAEGLSITAIVPEPAVFSLLLLGGLLGLKRK